MKSQSIAIIGAGTAGLASARVLAAQGHDITLLEQAPALAPVGAGILLQPTGLSVLQELGCYQALAELGAPVDGLHGVTSSGRVLMDTRYHLLGPGVQGLGVHRASLCHVLSNSLDGYPHQRWLGTRVDALRHDPQGVTVAVGAGAHQGEHRFDAALIANGSNSHLRPADWVRYDRQYPWGALWAIMPMEAGFDGGWLRQCYEGAHRMAGVLPTGRTPDAPDTPLLSFFWSLPVADMPHWRNGAHPFEQWKQETAAFWPDLKPLLARLPSSADLLQATYRDVILRRWGEGRLGIIGDAAHAMSPQLGQGGTMALLDAQALGQAMAEADQWPQVWAGFQRRRASSIRFYQNMSRWLTPLFQSHGKWIPALRDVAFPLMYRMPWLPRQMALTVAGAKRGLLR
ncbi:Oxidoreductase [Alloalcanivorax xenomutans]|uniref:FAD-dependent oxidoreductase n=1 Tax=Alloalcanivorax xenomutans TaxID=1094342 RepID=UPI0006D5C7A6|nr:NAD(P)/FAD-dependent oxidoreductase [Alloalcanivorax xenomutans]CUR48825.1 Oxidoreductase [Alloalcanivorax xenomutans]